MKNLIYAILFVVACSAAALANNKKPINLASVESVETTNGSDFTVHFVDSNFTLTLTQKEGISLIRDLCEFEGGTKCHKIQ